MTAVDGPQRLPVMTFEVGRAVGSQTVAISELKCDLGLVLSAMKCDMVNSLDGISEKRLALQRKVDPIGDQHGQTEYPSLLVCPARPKPKHSILLFGFPSSVALVRSLPPFFPWRLYQLDTLCYLVFSFTRPSESPGRAQTVLDTCL